MVDHVRTTTALHLRSEVKDQVSRLRERLEPDEQTLLILRVDRALSWREVAHVTLHPRRNPQLPRATVYV